jgi:V/A-type H+-transporting ATPase subunit G/H
MQGIELLKSLAEAERNLADRLEEARRSAADMIGRAEEERRRILAEAEEEIRKQEQESKARITAERERIIGETRALAESDSLRIRELAAPNIERAVELILSKVLP